MIEVVGNMPAGVRGIRVSGRVSGEDLRHFAPVMAELVGSGEIRLVEIVADDYEGFGPGGLVEDLKMGLGALVGHHSQFRRVAVVSDKEWVSHALHAFASDGARRARAVPDRRARAGQDLGRRLNSAVTSGAPGVGCRQCQGEVTASCGGWILYTWCLARRVPAAVGLASMCFVGIRCEGPAGVT
ncbi:STAS/SEC14 domain-containing protein [Micromonospora sp. WMMD737]|uniref:STAS/SEC14 domain-containing protein n=1 Tax=Micromonospora sp. WMMD737 TaxID=3404113 RepID=UPI003B944B34